MHQYKALVKANGMWVETVVFAQSITHAVKILQAQFGVNNTPNLPIKLK